MKGDFTRDSFDRTRDYYRVLLQQGRVQVDADWNEQIAILLQRLETLIVDVFGAHGGPDQACGFAVFRGEKGELALSRGRYYVNGLLCENREIIGLKSPVTPDGEDSPKAYLVYLDVHEDYVAAAQDPSLAEPALGGLDTAGRSRISWAAKYWPVGTEAPGEARAARDHWAREWERALSEVARQDERRSLLRARAASKFGYTGAQNQLYRVEIHQGGTSGEGDATWKWSRENASVAFAVTGIEGTSVELRAGPRAAGAISAGDWVEITNDANREDDAEKPPLYLVAAADPNGASLTLGSGPGGFDAAEHPIARRWDQRADGDGVDLTTTGGCLPVIEDVWLPLESGVEVYFAAPEGGKPRHYRGGDYWLIPARTATASIEWPADAHGAESRPPRGVRHRYAPLSGVIVKGDGLHPEHDFRIRRDPLAPR